MTTKIEKKPVFRIIMEKQMNAELEKLKEVTGVTIAEHMRRAMKLYLLFKKSDGYIDEVELYRFRDEYLKNRSGN